MAAPTAADPYSGQGLASLGQYRPMTDSKILEIPDILSEVDTLLRDRPATTGVKIVHVM
jgi:hypothetical protein